VLRPRKRAGTNVAYVGLERGARRGFHVTETLDEPGHAIAVAEQVVPHQHLTARAGARADADRRHVDALGDERRDLCRDRLEHDCDRTGRLQGERVVEQALRSRGLARLGPEPAERGS
jgi:hypothetical protein